MQQFGHTHRAVLAVLIGLASGCVSSWQLGDDAAPVHTSVIEVVNETSFASICAVYAVQPHAGRWGVNRLRDGAPIEPGQRREIAVARGVWNVRVADCSGRTLAQHVDLVVRHRAEVPVRLLQVNQRQRWRFVRLASHRPSTHTF